MTPKAIKDHVRTLLTAAQYEAWELHTDGHGARAIAHRLDISRASVISRLDAASLRLRRAGVYQDASGNWHVTPVKTRGNGVTGAETVSEGTNTSSSVETRGNEKEAA